MFGVSLLKIVTAGMDMTGSEIAILLTGMVIAYLVSLASIKFLMNYVRKHSFTSFGWYRIILGIVVIGFFLITGI